MKQTNNAIKFLMAQYRAIFKNAYFKGLTSAVLLTAGMAVASSAQAEDIGPGADSWAEVTTSNDITLSGEKNFSGSTATGSNRYYNNITINNNGTLKNSGAATISVKGDITVNSGGNLTLSGANSHIAGFNLGATNDGSDDVPSTAVGTLYNKNGGTITIGGRDSNSLMQMQNVVFESGSTTTINGSGGTTNGNGVLVNSSYIMAGIGDTPGELTIDKGATVNINDYGYLGIASQGTMTVNGTLNITATDTDSFAGIRATDAYNSSTNTWREDDANAKVILGKDAIINVKKGSGTAAILAPEVEINGAQINVEAESKFTFAGDVASTGNDSGSALTDGTGGASQVVMNSGKLNVNGTLVISKGSYNADDPTTPEDESKLTTNLNIQGGELTGTGTLQVEGSFEAADTVLQKFLTGGGSMSYAGGKSVQTFADGTDLAKYKYSGAAGGTGINFVITAATTFQGTNLSLSHELTQTGATGGTAAGVQNKLSVKADTLTLGGGTDFDSSATALGVKQMTAKDVIFKADAATGNAFTLQDKLVLKATQEITNPYDSALGTLTYAGTGTIDDDVIITGNDVSIRAGHYTTSDDITISGSSARLALNHNNAENVDVSLTLGSASTLTLADGATLQITGLNDRISVLPINFGEGRTRPVETIVDISDASFVAQGDSVNLNKILINNGSLIVNELQMADILDVDGGTSTNNVGIKLEGGANVLVEGDIQGKGNNGLDVGKLKSGTATSGATVVFSGDGTLEATGQIWLAAASSSDKLNLGDSGALIAESFRLDNTQDISTDDTSTVRTFTVADGTLVAGSSVTTSKTDHNSTLVLGDGTSSATLQLGYIEENTDEWGIVDHTYTTSSDTGSLTQNLTLSGSGSALKVNYGTWTAKDITVNGTSGSITVGDTTERFDTEGNEVVFNAALIANKLALSGTDAELTINSNGTVTVNGLTMSNGDVNVWGQMTVNGIEPESEETDPDHGVAITGGSITVTGRNAQLTFGDEAVKNISVSGDEVTVENFANNLTVNGYATLRLEFAEGTSFTEAALKDLRQSLLANATDGSSLDDGYIHLGNGTIDGLNVSGGTIDWDVLEGFKDIKDIRTTGLDSATLTNVDETDIITANVGNIQANGNTQNVQLSDTTLNIAKDLGNGTSAFITNANGEIISATVQGGAVVGFNGGGAVKDLVINSDSTGAGNDTVVNIAATGEAVTSFESIRGGEDTILNVDGVTNVAKNLSIDTLNLNHALTVGGDVTIGNGLYSDSENATPASLTTSKLTVTGNTYFDGNITASQRASFDSSAERDQVTYLAGNNTFNGGVEFLGGDDTFVELSTGTTTTTDLTLTNGVDLLISNNANVVADNVTVKGTAATGTGTIISVGEVAGKDGTEEWPDSTGYLTTTNLDLNGATLIVDPAYGMATSIAVTDTLGNLTISNNYNEYASGTLHGNLVAARNGIIAVGFDGYDDVTAIEEIQETFATLMDSNGSLQADNVGAIVYLGHNIEVQNGSKIVVDSTKNRDQYLRDVAVAGTYATNVNGNDVYIAKNSALAVDKNALSQVYNGDTKAAIHFNKDAATLYNDGGKIILTGDDFRTSDTIKLFTDNGGTGHDGILIKGQNLEVATLNGLLHFYLNAGEETTGKNLTLNYDQVDHVFNDASAPVKNSLIAYAAKDNNWDGEKADPLHGAVKSNIQTTDGKNYTNKADGTPVADSSNLMSLLNADGTTYTVYEKPNNYFLEEVVRGFSGADAETVARLGVFGGAAQSAIAAGSSTYDAVSGRMGVGANGANITVADNTQGAALWLAPIYKSSDSDGFDAEGVDYGVDMDLYGVALGADYTLSNGIRFGAMFNVGSGDIDGQGAGSAVSNDFDYYGFAVYGGYSMGALSLVADVSYTVADNDLEGNTSIDKVGASLDSTNLSVGVTGQYQLDFNGTTVTPHAGLRFSRIDLDDYTIDGEDVIADYDADSMNIFSIPVGVTFAKEFTGDAWTVKPSLDLTLTGNFGDDETDGTVHWAGVDNLSTNVSSEVIDNFTYGATLGVAAKTGNFSLGLGVNYTGSSNVDEFGVQANARFVF